MKNAVSTGAVHTHTHTHTHTQGNLINNVREGLVPALCKVMYALTINIETD